MASLERSERTVLLAGVPVHVRLLGRPSSRLPLVHVHGFGISGRYLLPTAQVLAEVGLNVVPDLPGYGRSGDVPTPLSIPALAEALGEVIDALALDRVVLVGNSMGCPVSIEAAHRWPDRVDGVVLVSPAGGQQNQPFARGVGQLLADAVREKPSMAPIATRDYLRFGPLNALRLFRELVAYPSLDRLESLPVRALAVLGDRDPLMPSTGRAQALARDMAGHITLVQLVGPAHAINYSHPRELAAVIDAWLEERPIEDQPGVARVLTVR